MIEHNGNFFWGTHDSPVFTNPEFQSVRTKFFGVKGESEIRGETGGRIITIHVRLHNRWSSSDSLMSFLDNVDEWTGEHGDLRITNTGFPFIGGVPRVYPSCTFEGFSKDPSDYGGPLPDLVGLLDGNVPSWWIMGTLQFRQLITGTN